MTEPPITLRAVHDSGTGNLTPTRVVIHATCPSVGYPKASAPGAAHGTALYFQQQAAGGSAHYVCGVDGEEHCVPDAVVAWHAPPNPKSIGIEITAEGGQYALSYTRDQWLSPQVWPAVQKAAARTRDLCDRYGIPPVKLSSADLLAGKHGICGHVDVSQAWKQSSHSDPGPAFPWPEFMQLVTQGADMPLTQADADLVATTLLNRAINRAGGPTGQTNLAQTLAWLDANLSGIPAAVWSADVHGTSARDRVNGMDAIQLPAIAKAVAKIPTTAPGSVTVDAAALAAALLADDAAVAKLADGIAAGLAKRVGNG